jgi:hypothetical protein
MSKLDDRCDGEGLAFKIGEGWPKDKNNMRRHGTSEGTELKNSEDENQGEDSTERQGAEGFSKIEEGRKSQN